MPRVVSLTQLTGSWNRKVMGWGTMWALWRLCCLPALNSSRFSSEILSSAWLHWQAFVSKFGDVQTCLRDKEPRDLSRSGRKTAAEKQSFSFPGCWAGSYTNAGCHLFFPSLKGRVYQTLQRQERSGVKVKVIKPCKAGPLYAFTIHLGLFTPQW